MADISRPLQELIDEISKNTRRWQDLSDDEKLKMVNDMAFELQQLTAALEIAKAAKAHADGWNMDITKAISAYEAKFGELK